MRHLIDRIIVALGWHWPPAARHRRELAPVVPELHHEWLPPTLPPVRTYRWAEVLRDYGHGRVSTWELTTWASVMAWRDRLDDRLNELAWGGGHIAHRDLATGAFTWTRLTGPAVTP